MGTIVFFKNHLNDVEPLGSTLREQVIKNWLFLNYSSPLDVSVMCETFIVSFTVLLVENELKWPYSAAVVRFSICISHLIGGTQWCSWLRHCATSRKVAGSISDCVTGIFH